MLNAEGTIMKRRRLLYWISVTVCVAGILLCGGLFFFQWQEYRTGELMYENLMQTVNATPLESEKISEDMEEKKQILQIDFELLKEINPQVIGWLYLPGTGISYPVVQGENNTYYLDHLFDGKQNSAGCLFLDCQCEGFTGKNSVIYGHDMKNGTMFASLKNYENQEYYEMYPLFYLITEDGIQTVDVFSAYVTEIDTDAWWLTFSSEKEYEAWLKHLVSRSCFQSKVTPSSSDQVITLSTCDSTFENARFVCHGIVRKN